jgi:predicted CoA-substrate-specific enzyme activase
MITAGIDAGSRSIKVVLFDAAARKVLTCAIGDQGIEQEALARKVIERACEQARLASNSIVTMVATGYGRNLLTFAQTTITEITCHARGVHFLAPDARSIIEIGGQDTKFILMEGAGRVRDFAMNDRCAAGTGRFLEVVATRLGVSLDQLGALGEASRQPTQISSTCVVFAETEIIGLLASKVSPADIAAGVQNAIAGRVGALAGRQIIGPVYFTGGVALQEAVRRALGKALNCPVLACPRPQYTGAIGAAILAAERHGTSASRASA